MGALTASPPGLQAIRDGVIEASINHEKGYVQSKEMIDIYSTREPQLAFHQRISFCLDIHNMSVKVSAAGPQALGDIGAGLRRRSAQTFYSLVFLFFQAMRFPPKSYNKDLESAEVRPHLGPCGHQGHGPCPQTATNLCLLPSRSAGSASSRTWSSQRRWQRMMMTVFRDPLAWLYFFICPSGRWCLSRAPPCSPVLSCLFYK